MYIIYVVRIIFILHAKYNVLILRINNYLFVHKHFQLIKNVKMDGKGGVTKINSHIAKVNPQVFFFLLFTVLYFIISLILKIITIIHVFSVSNTKRQFD